VLVYIVGERRNGARRVRTWLVYRSAAKISSR
jgi:hypothetical protein